MRAGRLLAHLSPGILLLFLCGVRGSTKVGTSKGDGGVNYWPRDSYVDAPDYAAPSAGNGGQIASFAVPSTDVNGGSGILLQNQDHGGSYGLPQSHGSLDAQTSYLTYATDYQGGTDAHNHNHNGNGHGYGHVVPEAPVYKYKYHIIPNQHHHEHHHTTEGWGRPKAQTTEGWGWAKASTTEGWGWSNGKGSGKGGSFIQDDYDGGDPQGDGDDKGGGGGGLAGLAGLAGLVGLVPLALLLIPLALLIPLPFVYFPPNTLDPTNGVLKLGRSGGNNVTVLANELQHALRFDLDGRRFLESMREAKKFAVTALDSVAGGKGAERNECVERLSCEFYQLARSYNVQKYIDVAFSRFLPFKSSHVVSRIARGIDGDCHAYACKPLFLAEKE